MHSPTRSRGLRCALLLGMAFLTACSANWHSIYRNKPLTEQPRVITLDAKQRAILASNSRICAEASPDVFAVIAQSFSTDASFSKSADPKDLEAALKVALATSEQASTIPRTQTVNLLRELMYRTCERFLADGYSAGELSIQAIRDQRLMVSVLAIEQLTNAATPRPVTISASAATGTSEALVRLDDARKASESADTDFASAQKAFNEANGDKKICDGIAAAQKAGTALTADQTAAQPKCKETSDALTKAAATKQQRNEQYADLKKLAGTTAQAAPIQAALAAGEQAGGSDASMVEVAKAVREIVGRNFTDGTEAMLFCLKTLQDLPRLIQAKSISDDAGLSLGNRCAAYLEANVGAAEVQLQIEKDTAQKSLQESSAQLFEEYWKKNSARTASPELRAGLATEAAAVLLTPDKPKAECFRTASTQAEVKACFTALPLARQRQLVR